MVKALLRRKDGVFQRYNISDLSKYRPVLLPPEVKDRFPDHDYYYVKIKLEFIGTEANTGNDLYYDPETGQYVEQEPTDGRGSGLELRRGDYLEIDETMSIETGEGHDLPFVCEITATTYVRGLGRRDIDFLVKDNGTIQKTIDDFFHTMKGFDQIKSSVMKTGVEFKLKKGTPEYPDVDVLVEKTEPRRGTYRKRVNL